MTPAFALLLPLAAGACCVLGFAPFYAWPVPIAALAALLFVWRRSASPWQAALSGFAFGLGYFLAGVSWVFVSLHEFGSMPAILAAIATFLFCAYLSLFPAAAGWIATRLAPDGRMRLALAVASFVALEWLRGWLFSGFPWLTLGTSQAPGGPFAGYAPYVGAYGTSLAIAGAAALLLRVLDRRGKERRSRLMALAGIAALLLAGAAARSVQWTEPAGPPVAMALLQGNVPQELKWRDDVRARTLADYRQMIFEAKAAIVVVPETALPAFFDQLPADYLESIRAHGREAGKDILLGTVEREYRGEEFDYYNSVVTLGAGKPQSYRKRHLVPFGEFIPPGFRWVLAVLKIPLSDFTKGPRRQAALLAGGVPFGIAICYEDIFGEEVIDALPDARILLNVSNDAWFGESFAAEQHLQTSQMRALETGRWMVRATNTGVTAAIDDQGRVVGRLAPFVAGTLQQRVTPRTGMTPYARFGNAPAILLVALLAAFAWMRRRRRAAP